MLLTIPAPETAEAQAALPLVEETRAEFQSICRQLTDGDNQWFGHKIISDMQKGIERSSDPLAGILLRRHISYELIRVGRHEEAIELLHEAGRMLPMAGRELANLDVVPSMLRLIANANLQLAETHNCITNHSATSCILPIRGDAVHSAPGYARAAGDALARIVTAHPEEMSNRWLLNLSRMLSGDYPQGVPEAFRLPDSRQFEHVEKPTWEEIGWRLGVNAKDLAGGAIMDDFDGDGLLDLLSSSWGPCDPLRAFRNNGEGGFEDVTADWGLDGQLGGLNLSHADFDGDGDLDILVLRGAWLGDEGRIRNSLLRNDLDHPEHRFVDVTSSAGMAYPAYPTQNAAWADYDLDGDLDVFLGNEATGSSTNPTQLFGAEGNPYPSQLFRNNADGTFTDVARAAGVQNRRFAKGSAWGDYDNDGDPDLYISNIGSNRLYRNEGDGTFQDVATTAGVIEPADVSFPTWFFDFDNDGDLDLFVARFNKSLEAVAAFQFGQEVLSGNPVLYLNEGGGFRDVSKEVGLTAPLLVMGANYGDLDNDGWLDVYLGTGTPAYSALMANAMYRNVAGTRFDDVTFETGLGHLQKGHGVAFGDLDNDGQQELFQQLGGAYPYDTYGNVLYENPGNQNHWLTLRLRSPSANSRAVGARIEVRVRTSEGERSIHRLAGSGGSFGGSSLQQEIGLGIGTEIVSVTIDWPDGERQVFESVDMDRIYDAVQGRPGLVEVDLPRIQFAAASSDHQQHVMDR